VARDPNETRPEHVQELRDAGFDDAQITALTVYVAGRMAFSAVNGALGAAPDVEYRTLAPEPVLRAVDYGRPIADG
jgi:alkylhydroperoxidase family enzyme